jgi:ABC-type transport system involved in cytochrome bd biosynthesis fused ATPase/permease subunit
MLRVRMLLEYVRAGRLLIVGASLASAYTWLPDRTAERIVLLDGGRVRAVGTHEELIDGSPLYRELAAPQLLVDDADANAAS